MAWPFPLPFALMIFSQSTTNRRGRRGPARRPRRPILKEDDDDDVDRRDRKGHSTSWTRSSTPVFIRPAILLRPPTPPPLGMEGDAVLVVAAACRCSSFVGTDAIRASDGMALAGEAGKEGETIELPFIPPQPASQRLFTDRQSPRAFNSGPRAPSPQVSPPMRAAASQKGESHPSKSLFSLLR